MAGCIAVQQMPRLRNPYTVVTLGRMRWQRVQVVPYPLLRRVERRNSSQHFYVIAQLKNALFHRLSSAATVVTVAPTRSEHEDQ